MGLNPESSNIVCVILQQAAEILYEHNRFSNDPVIQGIHFNLFQTRLVAALTQKLLKLV